MNGQKNSSTDDSLQDILCQNAYKVKDLVCDALKRGDMIAAATELNLFFAKSFTPRLFVFQPDKEELVKQMNKLLAKNELYNWLPFQKNIFPAIGVLFNSDHAHNQRLPGAYRTLFLLYKNRQYLPVESWKHVLLSDMMCDFYTARIRQQLNHEFGDSLDQVFDAEGQINDQRLYDQVVDFTRKRISVDYGEFKDDIEQRQFPPVLATIALQGVKAFSVRVPAMSA